MGCAASAAAPQEASSATLARTASSETRHSVKGLQLQQHEQHAKITKSASATRKPGLQQREGLVQPSQSTAVSVTEASQLCSELASSNVMQQHKQASAAASSLAALADPDETSSINLLEAAQVTLPLPLRAQRRAHVRCLPSRCLSSESCCQRLQPRARMFNQKPETARQLLRR
jgi:hypothetical protein